MDAAFERNAFRVLSLPADALAKEVYRQQQRIQNALELGDDDVVSGFPFIPKVPLSPEGVLEAVHRVEKQRAVEELFWVHELGGKFDFGSGTVDTVLTNLRADAGQNTTKGAVAQHNLAVILTCLAQGLNGSRRLDYWRDAIRYWNVTLSNDVFWQFMQDRDELSNGDRRPSTQDDLRGIARATIQRAVLKEVWNAVDDRDYKAIASLSVIIREYKLLLDADSTLSAIGNRMAKDGSVAIGGVLDRLSAVREDGDKTVARTALASAEKDLQRIGEEFEVIVQAFGAAEAFAGLYDARALAFKQLSVAYFNLVGDEPQALRLVMEARALARDPKLKSEVEAGWKHIRRALVCSEALALVEAKNYAAAQEKLAIALTLSTDEQKAEVQEMQEGVHRASVFRDVDTTKRNPSLYTFNGIGAKFYGRRDFDQRTNSYVTVHWFVVLFLPIIPLACYRVCDSGPNLYTIYGRVPLSPFLRKYRWAVVALIGLLMLVAMVSNFDTSGSSTSSSGRAPTPATYSSTPASSSSGDIFDRASTEQQTTSTATPAVSRVEKDAIEAERAELKRLSDSLDVQKQQIEEESAALQRMESYIRSVKDTYTEETVPESVREQYNSTIDEYNSRAPAYNRAVRAYNADLQQYKERIAAFNQRVDRYNANR
jgi:hypothetical protein